MIDPSEEERVRIALRVMAGGAPTAAEVQDRLRDPVGVLPLRERRTPVLLAVAAACALVVIGGFLYLSHRPASPQAQTPALVVEFGTDGLALEVPSAWKTAPSGCSVAGLDAAVVLESDANRRCAANIAGELGHFRLVKTGAIGSHVYQISVLDAGGADVTVLVEISGLGDRFVIRGRELAPLLSIAESLHATAP